MSLIRKEVKVSGSGRTSYFQVFSQDRLYMFRNEMPLTKVQSVAYAESWCLFRQVWGESAGIREGRGSVLSSPPGSLILIPPFSLVHWIFPDGEFHYEMFCSTEPLPPELSKGVVVFEPVDFEANNFAREGARKVFDSKYVALPPLFTPDSVSRRTMELICHTYQKNLSLGDIARAVGVHPSVMSRRFRQHYGIPAVKFRSLLRTMHAQEALLFRQHSVLDTATESGFESASHFSRGFRKHTRCAPSSYLQSN